MIRIFLYFYKILVFFIIEYFLINFIAHSHMAFSHTDLVIKKIYIKESQQINLNFHPFFSKIKFLYKIFHKIEC